MSEPITIALIITLIPACAAILGKYLDKKLNSVHEKVEKIAKKVGADESEEHSG